MAAWRLARERRRSLSRRSLAACALAGCGGAFKAPDLFIVQRSGDVAGAPLTLVVNEEGGLTCNGDAKLKLGDAQLIQARALQEELQEYASKNLSLAAQPGSVFQYHVRDENGSVRFADNSAGQPAVLRKMALFVLQVAQGVCHLRM